MDNKKGGSVMARIGMIGAGKLGLPVALAIESKGHEVSVYDVNPNVKNYVEERAIPYQEEDLQPLLDNNRLHVANSIAELIRDKDIVFCAIQTPHEPKYEGTTRLPAERADFNYTFLKEAVGAVATEAAKQEGKTTLAVISTCLPGTFNRDIAPLLNDNIDYAYVPQFIAMGTVLNDYLHPEFNLIGVHSEEAKAKLEAFYPTINDAPNVTTDITTAEGIKVSYNTWITAKTVIANLWGELAEKTGMNFKDIYKAWSLADKRLISTRYMQAGMGDGGGCHPRDNIAMSHLAREVGLSHNIFEDLMLAREATEEWHAELIADKAKETELSVVILGRSFKPETNIETGSPAILMANILEESGLSFKHTEEPVNLQQAVYFIATKNAVYANISFPKGSIVYDPFGYIEDQDGVEVVWIGRRA